MMGTVRRYGRDLACVVFSVGVAACALASGFDPVAHAVIRTDRTDGRYVSTRGVVQEMIRHARPHLAFDHSFSPDEFAVWKVRVREKLRELLRFPQSRPAPSARKLSCERRDGYVLERWEHYPLDGVAMPFLVLIPDAVTSRPAVLCIPGTNRSKESLAGEPELCPCYAVPKYADKNRMALEYCKAGLIAVAVDNPGFCETSDLPSVVGDGDVVWGEVSTLAKYLLNCGKNYMGYATYVDDCLLDWMRQDPRIDRTRMATSGHSLGAWMAGFLAILNEDVKAAVMNQCIYSWREAARVRTRPDAGGNRPSDWGMGAFYTIPGLYEWFDIPDVFASIAPRAAFYAEGMAENDRVGVYEPAYRIAGKPENMRMLPFPEYADVKSRFVGEMPEGLRAEGDFWKYVSTVPECHYFKGEAAVPWLVSVLGSERSGERDRGKLK